MKLFCHPRANHGPMTPDRVRQEAVMPNGDHLLAPHAVDRFSGSATAGTSQTPTTRRGFLGDCMKGLFAIAVGQSALGGMLMAEETPTPRDTPEEIRKRMAEQAHQVMDPNDETLTMKWPKNTRIYAATTQENPGYTENGKGAFTTRFLRPVSQKRSVSAETDVRGKHGSRKISRPKIKDLDGLMRALSEGWVDSRGRVQVPVLSPGTSDNKGWSTSDNGKIKRYVLLISGEGDMDLSTTLELGSWAEFLDPSGTMSKTEFVEALRDEREDVLANMLQSKTNQEASFHADIRQMHQALTRLFKLPRAIAKDTVPDHDTCFVSLTHPTPRLVKQVLKKWLGPRQDQNAEVLIYYAGHGNLMTKEEKDGSEKSSLPQGAENGQLWVTSAQAVPEDDWKKYFHRFLAGFRNVAFVADACHSGSLVASLAAESENSAIA